MVHKFHANNILDFVKVLFPPCLFTWALDFSAVDVVDDVVGRTSVDGAANRLSGSQDLFDGS